MAGPGNGGKAKKSTALEDPSVLGHLSTMNQINHALLVGLEAALRMMEDWDQIPEKRRRVMIVRIKGLIESGKAAFAAVSGVVPDDRKN